MKRKWYRLMLLIAITLCGCSASKETDIQRAQWGEDDIAEKEMEAEEMETQDGSQADVETSAPTKEEVFAMRERVLDGMTAEEIQRLTENIKVANLCMESAYLYENLFEKLDDRESLYWNYFDEKGDIQIGWSYDGSRQKMKEIMEREALSLEEFYAGYGTPVMVYNRFDAGNFMELIEEMKETVKNERLQDDLRRMIDETELAAKTHEMEHAYMIYQLLHDMDYYLLRYGVEDVGKYVKDVSTVIKYYGVLSVYENREDL